MTPLILDSIIILFFKLSENPPWLYGKQYIISGGGDFPWQAPVVKHTGVFAGSTGLLRGDGRDQGVMSLSFWSCYFLN